MPAVRGSSFSSDGPSGFTMNGGKQAAIRVAATTSASSVTPRRWSGHLPDDTLWLAVSASYPDARREFGEAVPERRFRIDIALVDARIAIEVDGWQYHGKFLRPITPIGSGRICRRSMAGSS